MHADVLIAEIGSTTTLVNAFCIDASAPPSFLGQGQADTTVLAGDVRIGLNEAIHDLKRNVGADEVTYGQMLATSSAAGGLRMCVHGLVYDMTVRAAEAAALGAGAIIRQTTAGRLTDAEIDEQRAISPNLILLAGGTDYGERETALYNARRIASLGLKTPVIYAGNVQNQSAVRAVFAESKTPLFVTENVYPRLDELNIEPARRIIHDAFERHIINAPGMEHIRDMVSGHILPTPGAVMEAAKLLYEDIGDLVVVDIGGATTDVHSVTPGSEELAALATAPEPMAKRTVEGDLGLYVNARNLIERIGRDRLARELSIDVDAVMAHYQPVPDTPEQFLLTERLCREAGVLAMERHAGRMRYLYLPTGRKAIAEGKDLTRVKSIIGTGGALTRLPHREALLQSIANCNKTGLMLYPRENTMRLLFDNRYIMASAGVLARHDPTAALRLLRSSLELS